MVMTVIAFWGIILPYHPFDYLYNHGIRHIVNKPKLQRRPNQLKFACIIATIWLIVIIYLFSNNYMVAGYVNCALFASIAILVGTTDFCIPSTIYNFLFKYKIH